MASISCAVRLPRNSIVTFDGERSTRRACAPEAICARMATRYRGIASLILFRYRGIAHAMRAPRTIRPAARSRRFGPDEDESLLDELELLVDRSRLASPESVMTRINRIWITKPLTLSISPIESAPPVSTPCRWKNRTSSATRAAELGTASWMNWTAYWSMRTGANRRSRTDAPIVENPCGTCESGARSRAVMIPPCRRTSARPRGSRYRSPRARRSSRRRGTRPRRRSRSTCPRRAGAARAPAPRSR